MSKQAKINNLKAKLKEYNLKLDKYEQMFMADGVIDEVEKAQLNKMKGVIRKAEAKLDEMLNAPTKERAEEASKSSKEQQKETAKEEEKQNSSENPNPSADEPNIDTASSEEHQEQESNSEGKDNGSAESTEEETILSESTTTTTTTTTTDTDKQECPTDVKNDSKETEKGLELPDGFMKVIESIRAERIKITTKLKEVEESKQVAQHDFSYIIDEIDNLIGEARRIYSSTEDAIFDKCHQILLKEEAASKKAIDSIDALIARIKSEEEKEAALDGKMKKIIDQYGNPRDFYNKLDNKMKAVEDKFNAFLKSAS